MKILALDTTCAIASVCIAEYNCGKAELLTEFTVNAKRTHSETLLSMIKSSLSMMKLNIADIDLFCCTSGPGSFTGVRIGVSVIKGLAFGQNKPCVPVSSLLALAYNAKDLYSRDIVTTLLDARGGRSFNASFKIKKGVPVRITEDSVRSNDEIYSYLSSLNKKVYLFGDCVDSFESHYNDPSIKAAPDQLSMPSAYSVAIAAGDLYENTEDRSVFTDYDMTPEYILPSQAEREKNKRTERK